MNTVDFGLYVYDLYSIPLPLRPDPPAPVPDGRWREMPGLLADDPDGHTSSTTRRSPMERLVVENAGRHPAAGLIEPTRR